MQVVDLRCSAIILSKFLPLLCEHFFRAKAGIVKAESVSLGIWTSQAVRVSRLLHLVLSTCFTVKPAGVGDRQDQSGSSCGSSCLSQWRHFQREDRYWKDQAHHWWLPHQHTCESHQSAMRVHYAWQKTCHMRHKHCGQVTPRCKHTEFAIAFTLCTVIDRFCTAV